MEPHPTDAGPRPAPSSSPPEPPAGSPRQLRRRPDDGHIAGVCAGLADYFNVDPVIVRIAAVVLLFTGSGAIAYALAWIFVPKASADEPNANRGPIDRRDRHTQIFGIALLALALSVIWGDWWSPGRRWFFPIGLIALGAWVLLRPDRDDEPTDPARPTWGWTATPTVPARVGVDPTAAEHDAETTEADTDTTEADTADGLPHDVLPDGEGDGEPPTPPWAYGESVPPVPRVPDAPVSTRRRRILGPIVFGALLIWSGLAWLFGVSLQNGLAVGLCLVGVGFVLGAFVGGSRVLILPALVVGAALAVTAVIDIPLTGPIGQQRWTPVRVADVTARHEVSVGEGTLDLTGVDVARGERLPVTASVGIGHLIVLVPRDLALDVTTTVGAGESRVLGVPESGVGVSTSRFDEAGTTGGTLVLDLQVGIGQIEVVREDSTRPSLSVPG